MVTKPHVLSTVTVSNLTSRVLPISGGLKLQPGQTRTVNVPFVQIQEEMVPRLAALAAAGLVTYSLTPGSPYDIGNYGGIIFGQSCWGSGNDGRAVLDGVNTFSWATLIGSTYTLLRECYLGDGSVVNTGITLYTASFKAFCQGTLTNNGLIHNDGKPAVGGTAGAASALGTLGIGTAGGNGRSNLTGLAGASQSNTLGDASMAGGAGGAGGANAGGAGGAYTSTQADGGADWFLPIMSGFIFRQTSGGNQAQVGIVGGGAGGGGGGSDNIGVTGGGGGGGGMILSLARYRSGKGTMTAPAGLGGAPIGTGVAGATGNAGHVNALLH